jgi:hypothetical protein
MRELRSGSIDWRPLAVGLWVAALAQVWTPGLANASVDPAEVATADATADNATAQAAPDNEGLERYKEEPVPGGVMLLIAYMVMWGLAIALVIRLLVAQSKLQAQVTELEERIGDDDSS